jgi:hypothetical protein
VTPPPQRSDFEFGRSTKGQPSMCRDFSTLGPASSDDELLLLVEFHLPPVFAALAGLVQRILPLRDYAFEPEAAHRLHDCLRRARKGLREQ